MGRSIGQKGQRGVTTIGHPGWHRSVLYYYLFYVVLCIIIWMWGVDDYPSYSSGFSDCSDSSDAGCSGYPIIQAFVDGRLLTEYNHDTLHDTSACIKSILAPGM